MKKDTYFIVVTDGERFGVGECALFRGLSSDDTADYERVLADLCDKINIISDEELRNYPSIKFGLETALNGLKTGDPFTIYDTSWSKGEGKIRINGLIWMGDKRIMIQRVKEKLNRGFSCLKLKIGGVSFEEELDILRNIRREYSTTDLELRLDANGAFSHKDALERLNRLSEFSIHSIEQPIMAGQIEQMAKICNQSPIAIALDEELIGVNNVNEKKKLLEIIGPQYIILKPALCGGFSGSEEWIKEAEELGIRWWATSALESNVGLNAIAQWCYSKKVTIPQGLGTGQLYTNNIQSPLHLSGEDLCYDPNRYWDLSVIQSN